MKAAVLHKLGGPPQCGEFDEPRPSDGHVVVEVEAAGVNHLDLAKASGTFYTGPPPVPSVVGSDGVGRLRDGRRVFFDSVVAPFGSMAERALVPREAVSEVADGVESVVAAALGNSGLAAWLALEWRAGLGRGESVLVLGATGSVGRIAVQVARELGAERVIAADLPHEQLGQLGADEVVELGRGDGWAEAFKAAAPEGVDVIVDPLWGAPAVAAMAVARRGARHVQVGQMASPTLELPASVVRSVALNIMGFAIFHAPLAVRRAAYLRLTEAAARGALAVNLEVLPLTQIGQAWDRQRRGDAAAKLVVACRAQ
jgi:NADPH:quinone reductase-like Zn-dependent oxidoreductase